MHDHVLIGIVSIITLGILAQWIAWRVKVPSILILLFFGFIVGPVTGFLKPDHLLGELLFPMVSLSVAIILFEGGLSLKMSDLKEIGGVVRNLIILGVPITFVVTYFGAVYLLDVDKRIALLLGAILVVTGPTVIQPILRSTFLSDKTASILRWEAILNDCFGAILAVLVFEIVLTQQILQVSGGHLIYALVKTLIVGSVIGYLAGWIMVQLLKRFMIPDYLQSVFTLMLVFVTFAIANHAQHESGLIAVTITGIFLANQRQAPIKHILEFKENLSVLAISTLFIILAGRLHLSYLTQLGWRELSFLAFIILICRPAAVFLSTIRSELKWQEKLYISSIGPRGIVAAAIASLFALRLEEQGVPDAEVLLSTIFWVIIVTIIACSVSSRPLANLLKLTKPDPQGIVFLGAHEWARKIATVIQREGFHVLMVDTNEQNVYDAHLDILPAMSGNILSEETREQLNLLGIGRFFALTPNDEVNSLACNEMSEVFGRAEVYQLLFTGAKRKDVKAVKQRASGRFLFNKGATFTKLSSLFAEKAEIESFKITEDYTYELFLNDYKDRMTPLFIVSDEDHLQIMTIDNAPEPKAGQTLIALVHPQVESPVA